MLTMKSNGLAAKSSPTPLSAALLWTEARKRATSVSYEDRESGERRTIGCEHIISTIPVGDFVTGFGDHAPGEVLESAGRLRTKGITVYGLLVKKQRAIDSLYIYYRDKSFHRVGEPKNAGLKVNPPDHTVLIVETTCEVGDAKWNGETAALDAIMTDLEGESICTRDEVVEINILNAAHGYPIFDLGFEKHLEAVNRFVDSLENVQTTGRQGGFCYPNMHKAMRMGADAAEKVLKKVQAG